jgi:hypothetical protein
VEDLLSIGRQRELTTQEHEEMLETLDRQHERRQQAAEKEAALRAALPPGPSAIPMPIREVAPALSPSFESPPPDEEILSLSLGDMKKIGIAMGFILGKSGKEFDISETQQVLSQIAEEATKRDLSPADLERLIMEIVGLSEEEARLLWHEQDIGSGSETSSEATTQESGRQRERS